MASSQEKKILKQMFSTTGLRPRLAGPHRVDEQGRHVYDSGDILSPGSGDVEVIGSQLSQALANLPQDRTFQRLAERGKFEGTPIGELAMLGAPGRGGANPSGVGPGGQNVFSPGPDIGDSVSKIRQAMEKRKDSSDYDERGRRKTFGMLGSGAFGMPAPEGPLAPERMPYQDVLQSAGITPDALMRIPGVSAVGGSTEATAARQAESEKATRQQEQDDKDARLMSMLQMLGAQAGDRSVSFDPTSGKTSIGAAPRQQAPSSDGANDFSIGNFLSNNRQVLRQHGPQMINQAVGQMGSGIQNLLGSGMGAAGLMGMPAPQMPTIGGPPPQEQITPDAIRARALERGIELTDEEIAQIMAQLQQGL